MDCCCIYLKRHDVYLVQTTDFFYPLIDDPYIMGRIACANVLSDLYAVGITECDNMLMLNSVSSSMSNKERDVVLPLMIQGFKDAALEADTKISGGETVENPWCIIGGVATAVCSVEDIFMKEEAVPGDVLVLTKPLGTQIATMAYNWLHLPQKWVNIQHIVTKEDVEAVYRKAMLSMSRLNRNAARLMRKYNARCATDVTGFGILGHAQNLVEHQKSEVDFIIHALPTFCNILPIARACGSDTKFLQGLSPETSGGILVCLSHEEGVSFCKEIEQDECNQAWVIGFVEKGNKKAKLIDEVKIIEAGLAELTELI